MWWRWTPLECHAVQSSSVGDVATLVINDDLYADVQRLAAADETTDTGVVEAALRSYLGPDGLIDRVHENHDVSSEDVLDFAYEELDAYRAGRDAV